MTTPSQLLAALMILCLSHFRAASQDQPPYSLEKERQLGRQLAGELEQKVNVIEDPIISACADGVARRLIEHCPYRLPVEVRVAADDQVNGFALPGGYLFVNTGVLRNAEGEAELAAVLAHLIAHLRAGGLLRTGGRAGIAGRLDLPLIFMGGWNGYPFQHSQSRLAIPLAFVQAQRALVFEADESGLRCLYEAGYDPQDFVRVLKRLSTEETKYAAYPSAAERLKRVEETLTSLPPRTSYLADAPEFSEAKRRVAAQPEQPPRAKAPPSLRKE